ncbi:signal peptidase I [candidate division BRC1 bacterium HGW-BRC1-1]|jgi:signal peptidase I|nr:MAG: signal peptidase I [candidate division BRC1 bacterium HGW-BRC1-1]
MAPRDNKKKQADNRSAKAYDPLRDAADGDDGASHGVMMVLREWSDALIFAFVLAMFIRTFVVELFKIPSGSMSPTLLGDFIAEGVATDENRQSGMYLIIRDRHSDTVQTWLKDNKGVYEYEGRKPLVALTSSQRELLNRNIHLEEHRIFVNKFAYWFTKPDRGDISVFRVPFDKEPRDYARNGHVFQVKPYNRNQGVYVKRVAGLDGEQLDINDDGRLAVNGKEVEAPPIFTQLRYNTTELTPNQYSVTVPDGGVIMLGDNSDNSEDSRYWGGVPYENLRGKAFFRYWPVGKWSFLNP